MSRPLSLALVSVLLLVGATVAHGGTAGTAAEYSPSQLDGESPLVQSDRFATTTFTVEVYANGSARWTFSHFTPALDDGTANGSDREEFEAYAERFESEETDLWRNFQERATALAQAGTEATGRNMTASDFEREAEIRAFDNRGAVHMSFMWSDFAQVQDEAVVVADVFEGVFYIGPDQWLVFEAGPDLQFVVDGITPEPDEYSGVTVEESESITYFGEQQFADNNPRVTFTSADAAGESEPIETTAPASAGGWSAFSMLALGVLVLVVGLGAVAVWRSGLLGSGGEGGVTTDDAGDDGPSGTATPASAASTPGDSSGDAEPAVPEEELLTDEDRVIKLLEDNGGRMKQANIVDETGWSKSKVSMLLSDMEDEGDISKLRVGRENIVSLAGHEPDAAGSPFDDE